MIGGPTPASTNTTSSNRDDTGAVNRTADVPSVAFCSDELWDSALLVQSTWPHLTSCFQNTVLVYIPFGWLCLALPFYLLWVTNKKLKPLPLSWLTVSKLLMATSLCLLSFILILYEVNADVKGRWHNGSPSACLAYVIRMLSYLAVIAVMCQAKRHRMITSTLLFYYWLSVVIFDVVPFYSACILKEYRHSVVKFGLFVMVYVMEVLQLFLQGFAEIDEELSANKNISPQLTASYANQLVQFWMSRIVYRGWREKIKEKDLFELPPFYTANEIVQCFDKYWNPDVDNRNRARKNSLPNNGELTRSSVNNEKQYLMTTLNGDKRSHDNATYSTMGSVRERTTDRKSKPSLATVLLKMGGKDLLSGLVYKLLSDTFLFLSPLLLSLLITHVADVTARNMWEGYAIAALLFFTQMFKSIFFHRSIWISHMVGLRYKSALTMAIYKKAVFMATNSKTTWTVGEIVNFMSVDCFRVHDIMRLFFFGGTVPIQVLVAVFLLYAFIGASSIVGLLIMLIVVPINGYITKQQKMFNQENLRKKDGRLQLTNEALNGMKVVKLYAWEPAFQEMITTLRNKEIRPITNIAYTFIIVNVLYLSLPYLVTLTTFAVYVSISDENVLDANKVFVALTLYNLLKMPLTIFSSVLAATTQARVSCGRIDKFLCTEDLTLDNVQRDDGTSSFRIDVDNATFTWNTSSTPSVKNITLRIPHGKLYAVVGPVGSGKSSLVSALLGELERLSGKACIQGSVAYVAQQAWIQNATVRDNILFGKPFNKKFYDKVLNVCALERDLSILPAGDLTEIGERGINLSGGQKQRVNLARAVYSEADIYLLDDPLSAVDSHVGKHIFTNVIGHGGVLKKKTRLLVTHGAHWLPMVDCVVVMQDGAISETGSYENIMAQDGAFANFIKTFSGNNPDEEDMYRRTDRHTDGDTATSDGGRTDEEMDVDKLRKRIRRRKTTSISRDDMSVPQLLTDTCSLVTGVDGRLLGDEDDLDDQESGRLTQNEQKDMGKMNMKVFAVYRKAIGTMYLVVCMLLYVLFQVFSTWANFWLRDWVDDPFLTNVTLAGTTKFINLEDYYLGILGLFGILQIAVLIAHSMILFLRAVAAAKYLHERLLYIIFRLPMQFFDTTPLGRIMNRFTRDIEVVDTAMPVDFKSVVNSMANCLSTILVICITTPMFLIMTIPILLMFILVWIIYIPTSSQLKRMETVTRSPIYSHFSETITGISTIRAYGVVSRFIDESVTRLDRNQKAFYLMLASNRWLAVYIEIISNLVLLGSAMFAVATPGISGGTIGLAITYATQMSLNIVWVVRSLSDMEINAVSLERLREYSELEPEADWICPEQRPPIDWPQHGEVTFSQYKTRYREGLELVLKGITCQFTAGEKIGIVGRTGAGKSSLALSLFRLIEATEGCIKLDGVRISDIGLHDLRSRLTILPQEPLLFFGSLRMNLDPLQLYDDPHLWTALTRAHLKEFVDSLPGGLDYHVGEEGQMLSVGQRQLVCLARALLRKTKILMLDEATAAVDIETDQLIQNTIRKEFADSTIITIAHRLNTIMDYDRILVLDNGEIKEFDTPTVLLAQQNSAFYSMVKEANLI